MQDPTLVNPTVLLPVDPMIERYLFGLHAPRSDHPVLQAMESLAVEKNFPIIGRLVGQFLLVMARAIGARRVFEFGSGYGYSAYWFAEAVGAEGQVICAEGSADNATLAAKFLGEAGLWSRVDFRTGMAQQIFATLPGEFDICYNDADKGDYPEIWHLARSRIRPGGLYIADNVLWHGRVAVDDYVDVVPGWTEAILAHNRAIVDDPEFDTFINPVRDGVIVARRKI